MKSIRLFLAVLLLTGVLTGCGKKPLFTPLETSVPEPPASSAELSEPAESSEPESSEIAPASDPYLGQSIPESAALDESYFDDAVFIGDSLTYGLGAYQVLDAKKVIAHTGINPQTILTKSCIEQPDGSTLTVLEAAKAAAPRKVYLMLGSNGVAFLSQEKILEFYGEFLDQLQEALPDAIFYVQSVLPVTREKEQGDANFSNVKIDALNEALMAMAEEKGAYYLNVAEAIKDENGCLPSNLSADGMHFGVSTYRVWVEYLLSHTIDETLLP